MKTYSRFSHPSRFFLVFFALLLFPAASFASASSNELLRFFPASTDMVFQIDPTQEGYVQKEWREGVKKQLLAPAVHSIGQEGVESPTPTLPPEEIQQNRDIITSLLSYKFLTLALDSNSVGDVAPTLDFLLVIDNVDGHDFLDFNRSFTGNQNINDVSDVDTIFFDDTFSAPMYISQRGSTVILSNQRAYLEVFLKNIQNPSQSFLQPSTLDFVKNESAGSLINIILKPQFLSGDTASFRYRLPDALNAYLYEYKGFTPEALQAILAQGISVVPKNNGFSFTMYGQEDKAYLQKNNLVLGRDEFTPSLYHELSGDGLIFYTERNNLAGIIQDNNVLYQKDSPWSRDYTFLKELFHNSLGIDLEKDILPLLDSQTMLTVHNQENIFPGFTLMVDVNKHQQEAVHLVGTINLSLQQLFSMSGLLNLKTNYKYTTETIKGVSFYTHTLSIAQLFGDEDLAVMPDSAHIFTIRIGITPDNKLVISTYGDFAKIFHADSQGLLSDVSLKNVFEHPEAKVLDVFYANADEFRNYISFISKFASEGTILVDMEKRVKPWHTLFFTGSATDDTLRFNGQMNLDVTGAVSPFADFFAQLFPAAGAVENNDTVTPDTQDTIDTPPVVSQDFENKLRQVSALEVSFGFCDVESQDWFYGYMHSLYLMNVLQGKGDGCMHPNDAVTRAEFAKMVITAYDAAETMNANDQREPWIQQDTPQSFTDVHSTDWYNSIIQKTSGSGMMKGYGDGTFHPNASITRAEAVQTLYNLDESLAGYFDKADEPFIDVNEGNWFYKAVRALYNGKFIQGFDPDHFAPQRNLTRAEAAKLVVYGMLEKQHHKGKLQVLTLPREEVENYNEYATGYREMVGVDYDTNRNFQLTCEDQKALIELYGLFQPDTTMLQPKITDTSWYQVFNSDRSQITLSCHQPAGLEGQDSSDNKNASIVEITQVLKNYLPDHVYTSSGQVYNKNDSDIPSILDTLGIKILDGAQKIAKSDPIDGTFNLTYEVQLDFIQACEAQQNLLKQSGWEVSPMLVQPSITGELWVYVFDKDAVALALACSKSPTKDFSWVTMAQYPKDSSANTPDTKNKTYDTPEYSIQVPQNWQIIEKKDFIEGVPPETDVVFRAPFTDASFTPTSFIPTVTITKKNLEKPLSSAEFAQSSYGRLKSALVDFQESRSLEDQEITYADKTISGSFVVYEGSLKTGDMLLRYRQLYVVKGTTAYIITAAMEPSEALDRHVYMETNIIMDAIVKSFALHESQ